MGQREAEPEGGAAGTHAVTELVRSATVVVSAGSDPAHLRPRGSGFFVADGRVLTCAHCVHGDESDLWVEWRGGTPARAKVLAVDPPVAPAPPAGVPHPDAAVLGVAGLGPHPCVPLATGHPAPNDPIFIYGISNVRIGIPEPDGSTTRFDSIVGPNNREFYKLGLGEVAPGMSGGPVLDLKAHAVCGMVKSSRTLDDDHGGHAVPISDVLAIFGEDLRAANLICNGDTLEALRAAQAGYGPLPVTVAALLQSKGATALVETFLRERYGVTRPEAGVPDDGVDEWVARQLFSLSVGDLVAVMVHAQGTLKEAALEVCQYVAGCLPVVSERPESAWVPSDAAVALALELRKERPRVVRVGTERPGTRQVLLHRALCGRPELTATNPSDGKPSGGGPPPDLVDELKEAVAQRYSFDVKDWDDNKDLAIAELRKGHELVRLDSTVLLDLTQLTALMNAFGGMRFVVCSRSEAPAGADPVLLDLRPPIDQKWEGFALGALQAIEKATGLSIGTV